MTSLSFTSSKKACCVRGVSRELMSEGIAHKKFINSAVNGSDEDDLSSNNFLIVLVCLDCFKILPL